MTLQTYIRERYEALSDTAKRMIDRDREYQAYTAMVWERDFYRAEVERLKKEIGEK